MAIFGYYMGTDMDIDVDKSFFYKLHILKSSYDGAADTLLRRHADINIAHFTLLSVVHRFQPITQQEIAQYIDITPGAISRQVSLMRDKGLLSIQNDGKDRRKQLISLSEDGTHTYETAKVKLRHLALYLFGDEAKRAECIELIDTILERINTYSESDT